MHVDEVEDLVETIRHDAIEAIGEGVHVIAIREMFRQHDRREVGQVQPGRFQWFDEVSGEADRNAVLDPGLRPVPDLEIDEACVESVGVRSLERPNLSLGILSGDERARVHIAQRTPVLQRNLPDPAVRQS